MENPAAKHRSTHRGLSGRVALWALLALGVTGASNYAEADPCSSGIVAPKPSEAGAHLQAVRPPEHSDPCADGTIDAFEDDDSGCDGVIAPNPEATESLVLTSSRVARPVSDALARSRLARGPPPA